MIFGCKNASFSNRYLDKIYENVLYFEESEEFTLERLYNFQQDYN